MSILTTLLGWLVGFAVVLVLIGLWAAGWGIIWAVLTLCWWAGWVEPED